MITLVTVLTWLLFPPPPSLLVYHSPFNRSVERAEELIQSGLDIQQFVPRSHPSRSRVSSLLVTPPPSPSPMMSRRTTVIEEWSQLQRTRSLSHSSKPDRGERGEKEGTASTKVRRKTPFLPTDRYSMLEYVCIPHTGPGPAPAATGHGDSNTIHWW